MPTPDGLDRVVKEAAADAERAAFHPRPTAPPLTEHSMWMAGGNASRSVPPPLDGPHKGEGDPLAHAARTAVAPAPA